MEGRGPTVAGRATAHALTWLGVGKPVSARVAKLRHRRRAKLRAVECRVKVPGADVWITGLDYVTDTIDDGIGIDPNQADNPLAVDEAVKRQYTPAPLRA